MQSSYRIPPPTHTHTVFLLSIFPVLSFLCNASSWLSPISPTKTNYYKFRIISSHFTIFIDIPTSLCSSGMALFTLPSSSLNISIWPCHLHFCLHFLHRPHPHSSPIFFIYAKVVADEALRVWSLCPTVVALGYFLCYTSSLCFTMDMQRTGGSVRLL